MGGPYLWVSCAGRTEGPVDLSARSSYHLSSIGEEFFGRLRLKLRVEGSQVKQSSKLNIAKAAGVQLISLQRQGDVFLAQIDLEQDWRGKVGNVTVSFVVRIDETSYPLDLILGLDPANLQRDQYEAMLQDIMYWVFFSLSGDVQRAVGFGRRAEAVLRPALILLELVRKQVDQLADILDRIRRAPHYAIAKRYYITDRARARRIDSRSLEWEAQKPWRCAAETLTFQSEVSYDVYENRFLLFFLRKLHARSSLLQQVIDRTIRDVAEEVDLHQKHYGYSSRLPELQAAVARGKTISSECSQIRSDISRLQDIPFLRTVNFSPGQFRLNYSLALTQDFDYGRAFDLYRRGRDERIDTLDWQINYSERLTSLGIRATADIYEYWAFISVYRVLLEMRFSPTDRHALTKMIRTDVLNPCLQPGKSIKLVADPSLYGELELRLYFNHSFWDGYGRKEYAPRPDVALEFRRNGRVVALVALDAKYKDYDTEVEVDDLEQCRKYLDRISDCRGAFLLHLSRNPRHKNYGGFIRGENGQWRQNGHRYGYVPLIPGPGGTLTPLRTLIGMTLRLKLGIDPCICWTCGSDDVRAPVRLTPWGEEKTNKRQCQNCGNEWWINKCGCGFPLYKGDVSFQVEHQNCPRGRGNYFCPGCGTCFCGADVSDELD